VTRLILVGQQNVNLRSGYYESLDDILSSLNKEVDRKFHNSSRQRPPPYYKFPNRESLTKLFTFQPTLNKVLLHLPDLVSFTFSKKLANLLGFDNTFFQGPIFQIADRTVDLNLQTGSLFIYLSIVQDRVVGDVRAPLIGLLPISNADKGLKLASRSFYRPQYFSLKQNFIDNVTCNIRDEFGQLVPFTNGQTTLTLHLRRRRPL